MPQINGENFWIVHHEGKIVHKRRENRGIHFEEKKTPTSKGVRCRRNKHTMRKLHGANLKKFIYI